MTYEPFNHGPCSVTDAPFIQGELVALLQSYAAAYAELKLHIERQRGVKTLEKKLRTKARRIFMRVAGRKPTEDELDCLCDASIPPF